MQFRQIWHLLSPNPNKCVISGDRGAGEGGGGVLPAGDPHGTTLQNHWVPEKEGQNKGVGEQTRW